jgi:hypothetical protein
LQPNEGKFERTDVLCPRLQQAQLHDEEDRGQKDKQEDECDLEHHEQLLKDGGQPCFHPQLDSSSAAADRTAESCQTGRAEGIANQ